MKKIIGTQLIVLSIVLIAISVTLFWAKSTSNTLSFINYTAQATEPIVSSGELGAPMRFIMNDVGINLEIFPATIQNDRWDSTYQGISHLSTTPLPGEQGNSVLYGHNWESLLGPLNEVEIYDTVQIVYDQGVVKEFKVIDIRSVSARETSILEQTDDIRLTIYTCSGFLDTQRFVVTALAI